MSEVMFYYGKPDQTGLWEQVASIFAAHESLKSEKTSSLPLVEFWKRKGARTDFVHDDLVEQFLRCCNIRKQEFDSAKLYYEYPVPVNNKFGGKGKASMTDLMVVTTDHVIAIEAKWTECRRKYELVKDWNAAEDDNKEKVLSGWLAYINEFYDSKNVALNNRDVAYQFIHRVASACYLARELELKPMVVYQLFYDNTSSNSMRKFADNLYKNYNDLFDKDFLGTCASLPMHVISVEVGKYPSRQENKRKKALNELFIEMQQKEDVYSFSRVARIVGEKTTASSLLFDQKLSRR